MTATKNKRKQTEAKQTQSPDTAAGATMPAVRQMWITTTLGTSAALLSTSKLELTIATLLMYRQYNYYEWAHTSHVLLGGVVV